MKHNNIIIFFIFSILCQVPAAQTKEKIWDFSARKNIPEKLFFTDISQNKIILINGESDNPDHYRLKTDIIQALIHRRKPLTLFFGDIERSKQNAFHIFRQKYLNTETTYDATGLDILLDWPHTGRPKWRLVKPVFDLAMIKKLPIKAVKLSRYDMGLIFNQGKTGLPEDLKGQLLPLLSQKLPEKITAHQKAIIVKKFCATLPEETINKLSLSDQIQAAYLAHSLSKLPENSSGVLITGEDHWTKNSALTHYLTKLGLQDRVIIIEFNDTGKKHPQPELSVDYIWYTTQFPRKDPCVMIRQ